MSDIMIALVGNPNVGKSTVFNALTGSDQHVGNWSGKTVEISLVARRGQGIETLRALIFFVRRQRCAASGAMSAKTSASNTQQVYFAYDAEIDAEIDLPMVLPPSAAGIALLIAFGRRGLLGAALTDLGLSLAFSTTAVVLAQIFVAAPFYFKAAIAGFAGVDRDLEQAAAIDGANAWDIFRHMTVPLAIYIGLELDLGVALTLSVILLATSFLVLFVVKGLLRQQVGGI